MGETSISWTHKTRNLVYGCRKIDTHFLTGACSKCYIFRALPRYGYDPTKLTFLNLDNAIKDFRKWSKEPGVKRIFLNNYSDTFHEDIPFETIELWHEKIIEAFPNFDFQILTKRIGRAMMFYKTRPVPNNVWLGTTIGARDRLFRIKQLTSIAARIHWISAEPLLEDLGSVNLFGIEWMVVGGESDPKNPRPMKPEWAVNLANQCKDQGVPYFFKQRGGRGFNTAGGEICYCCESRHQEFPN